VQESSKTPTIMSVDLKKYRIRVHKAALHLMGDPKYIQLLVNPQEMAVAIRSVDQTMSGDQTHLVSPSRMKSDFSYEIYSQSFVKKLCEVVGGLDSGYSYHISGVVLHKEKVALYSLKTIRKMEG